MPTKAQRLALEAQGMIDQADREGRALTGEERSHVQGLLDRATEQHGFEKQFRELDLRLGAGMGSVSQGGGSSHTGGPGDVFVKSEGYKSVRDPGARSERWSTGAIDVGLMMKGGTLMESVQGGGFVATPTVVPGVIDKLFQPLTVVNALGSSQTSGPMVRYLVEGTATSGAAGVAEGGTKPASDLAYSTRDEPVKKVATTLGPISDELIEDVPSISSYLNQRLGLFVRIEEERQILRGAGTNELVGIMDSSRGINTYTKLAADDNAVALAKVLANTAGSAFVDPDLIVMHPTNWLATRLLRDGTGGTVGQFYGGGPMSGAYGQGGAAGMFGQQLWNVPVVLSNVVGPGTALVGNFASAAHLFRRGGLTVEATNSHASLFVTDQVMIRAESRAALAVYRPVAFTEVRGLA